MLVVELESLLLEQICNSNNPKDLFKIASELDNFNKERQILEERFLKNFNEFGNSIPEPVIIVNGKNWHEGVIGIVASRIKDKFNKPVSIISVDDVVLVKPLRDQLLDLILDWQLFLQFKKKY